MRICVYGLWHLGAVTAACVAEHFETRGWDPNAEARNNLREGEPPLFEPGLAELVQSGLASGKLSFPSTLESAACDADIVWVAFDTPVDDNDHADVAFVERAIDALIPTLKADAVVLVSSQVPVGFTHRLAQKCRALRPDAHIQCAYSPENLRLGGALRVFRQPERIVVGVPNASTRERLAPLFAPFCSRILWMSVASAEMTKHALNSFLAVSVSFANEIASMCEVVGADAREVAAALKSDARIGERAYLSPGSAFAGGTLARDLVFLEQLAAERGGRAKVLSSALASNHDHKNWPREKLLACCGSFVGRTAAVWGLAYKEGTSTLRRSEGLDLCKWLHAQGAHVRAYDPQVKELPSDAAGVRLCTSARESIDGADVLAVLTSAPQFKELAPKDFLTLMKAPAIVDPNCVLDGTTATEPRIRYWSVGRSEKS